MTSLVSVVKNYQRKLHYCHKYEYVPLLKFNSNFSTPATTSNLNKMHNDYKTMQLAAMQQESLTIFMSLVLIC